MDVYTIHCLVDIMYGCIYHTLTGGYNVWMYIPYIDWWDIMHSPVDIMYNVCGTYTLL